MNFFMEMRQQPNSSQVLCIALETDSLLEETLLTINTICRSLFQLPKILRDLSKVKLRNMTASLLKSVCVCLCVCV